MRRAFYEMGEHISKVDTEILSWTYYQDEKPLEVQPLMK